MEHQIFGQKVEAEILAFLVGILANFLHALEMIKELGPAIGKLYGVPLGNGLNEIRAKVMEGIGRTFFCTV